MVCCGLGMQQYAMHNAAIQETTFFELGVYSYVEKINNARPQPHTRTEIIY